MDNGKLREAQVEAIRALTGGKARAEAAEAADVSERTVYR